MLPDLVFLSEGGLMITWETEYDSSRGGWKIVGKRGAVISAVYIPGSGNPPPHEVTEALNSIELAIKRYDDREKEKNETSN